MYLLNMVYRIKIGIVCESDIFSYNRYVFGKKITLLKTFSLTFFIIIYSLSTMCVCIHITFVLSFNNNQRIKVYTYIVDSQY